MIRACFNVAKFVFLSFRDVYRCARSSDWGDQLPVIQRVDEDVQTDSE